jgi:hypothetical protein
MAIGPPRLLARTVSLAPSRRPELQHLSNNQKMRRISWRDRKALPKTIARCRPRGQHVGNVRDVFVPPAREVQPR